MQIRPQFEEIESKNKLLKSVAGGGVESVSQLNTKYDKFQLMMDSFQMMIKEQVEMMRQNTESRISEYEQKLEKFGARWSHVRNQARDSMDADVSKWSEIVSTIKERKEEFEELEKVREQLR